MVKSCPSWGLNSQTPDEVMNSQSLHYQPEIFPSELSCVTTGSHLSYHILIHAIFFDFSRIHWAEFLSFLQYVFESILISNVRKVSYFKFKKENCLKNSKSASRGLNSQPLALTIFLLCLYKSFLRLSRSPP